MRLGVRGRLLLLDRQQVPRPLVPVLVGQLVVLVRLVLRVAALVQEPSSWQMKEENL